MNWINISLTWYFYLLIIGLIFFPLTKKIFGVFFDQGYAFSKTIGIIFLSYISLFFGVFKLIKFTQFNLILFLGFFLLLAIILLKTNKNKINYKIIIFEEILFFLSLFLWIYIRGQEPSIHGLEKFMDFGFINSILKSEYFPPKDMWLAGESINYYYFGHLTGALLIKLSNVASYNGYNLILATIFALSITQTFSLILNVIQVFTKKITNSFVGGILGSFLLNFAGNLHTIYLFTKGYAPDKDPIPFWEIFSKFNPENYWYPNATRFIPFTIHEFPIYSYVVADLHGHVFDIPFVLLTILLCFLFYFNNFEKKSQFNLENFLNLVFIGFMISVNFMTNAFDGPIYILLITAILFVIFLFKRNFFIDLLIVLSTFTIFNIPFSSHFKPFVSGVGVNCAPDFLVNIGKIGPFIFEKNNCQVSEVWMLFVLWGFFIINFLLFSLLIFLKRDKTDNNLIKLKIFNLILFCLSFILIFIPEFFYVKDIYPLHFRANTMFKLGYQAFIMLSIAVSITFIILKEAKKNHKLLYLIYFFVFLILFGLVGIYPNFAISSYYGKLDKTPDLNGQKWILNTYSEYSEIINFLNKNKTRVNILEAQGDSYTDYNVVSSFTGNPTIIGWYVHEWLWRGNPEYFNQRITDSNLIYESKDIELTKKLIQKYQIKYVIIGRNERKKYKNLNEEKLKKIGKQVLVSSNLFGSIYEF